MAQEFNNIELKDENVNTNKTSRRSFIKKWGILSLAGLFGLSKMGNMPVVKAAVNDNAEAKDISNDVIRCNTNDVFTSGETAADLADAVNGLNQSFSNALTDLKNTDVAKAVGANGSKFPTVIGVLGAIKTYLSGAVSKNVQVGSSYKIPKGYHDGTSEIKAVAKSGTNPTKITTNGTHSTGGYETVNVQVSSTQYIGEGTSFNIKSKFSNYALLKTDNFLCEPVGSGYCQSSRTDCQHPSISLSLIKNYDSSTGILTAYVNAQGLATNGAWYEGNNTKLKVKAYLLN